MIEDILRYFDGEEEEEYKTNQYMIGMRYLFRGYVVKSQKSVNFAHNNYTKLNKILIKHCIYYYKKYQDHRNEMHHNPEVQKKRVLEWYKKIKTHVK